MGKATAGPTQVIAHTRRVSSVLAAIPIERRRRAAATLGLFSVLFLTMGVVAMTGSTPNLERVFSGIALAVAVLLGLVAWGVSRSVALDVAELRLDAAIDAAISEVTARADAVAPHARHATPECGHDGSGTGCSHSCDTCVLSDVLRTMRQR